VLLVDDDALMRRSLAFNLDQAGYSTQTAGSAEDALAIVRLSTPDLVLLDIGLPGMDGLAALRTLRDDYGVPVIMLTARRRELDQVLGLELGADDYVSKPFDLDVLLARMKAVLRRSQAEHSPSAAVEPVQVGDLMIDPGAHQVILRGRELVLSPREFDLLHALVRSAGSLMTIDDLLSAVWGAEFSGQPQVVYVHIRWLREKIEDDPEHPARILTVRGLGYRYAKELPVTGNPVPVDREGGEQREAGGEDKGGNKEEDKEV
jgi:DNA-binding response OmpR family regulator